MKNLSFLAVFVVSAVLLTSCGGSGGVVNSVSTKLSVRTDRGSEEAGVVSFFVVLSKVLTSDVTFRYSTSIENGTGDIQQSDFTEIPEAEGRIVAGEGLLRVDVDIDDDDLVERDETFSLILSNVSGADFEPAGDTLTARGVIVDNDYSLLSVGATIGSEETLKATFNVSLSSPSPENITFKYSTMIIGLDGTAQQSDFIEITEVEGMIEAGERTLDIVVEIEDDDLAEGNEAFSLVLSDISGVGAVFEPEGDTLTATGTIIDDDGYTIDFDSDGMIDIDTAEQLYNIRYNEAGNSYKISESDVGSSVGCPVGVCTGYELLGDIDLSSDWVPIPTFSSVFDGGGYTIKNVIVNTGLKKAGFFSKVYGTVKNLKLRGGSITSTFTGSSNFSGAVAGELIDGIIDTVSSDLTVNGRGNVGGLVGYFSGSGTVQSSYATGNVSGARYSGGLVGYVNGGIVQNSYATGAVTGNDTQGNSLGGLVGNLSGGLFDAAYSTIQNSYATGTVNGGTGGVNYVGGLVGIIGGGNTVINSYAIGDVYGGTGAGDTVGRMSGLVIGRAFANYVLSSSTLDGENERTIASDQVKVRTEGELLALVVDVTETNFAGNNNGWSENNWNFTTDKYPSLKSYKLDENDAQIEGELICNKDTDWVQC